MQKGHPRRGSREVLGFEFLEFQADHLFFSSIAYCLIQSLRRLGQAGIQTAKAQRQRIRVKPLKIGARNWMTAHKVRVSMAEGCPFAEAFGQAFRKLKEAERLLPQAGGILSRRMRKYCTDAEGNDATEG
ncbi:MAG: transposase [Chloroflexi bacterium]|nr:transposase [Chloroflexota bacterium]